MIKDSMIKRFNNKGETPIYDPTDFEIFCLDAGATSFLVICKLPFVHPVNRLIASN